MFVCSSVASRARRSRTRISSEEIRVLLRLALEATLDRKSTRLNSSHLGISYAVFCLKKKKQKNTNTERKHQPLKFTHAPNKEHNRSEYWSKHPKGKHTEKSSWRCKKQ